MILKDFLKIHFVPVKKGHSGKKGAVPRFQVPVDIDDFTALTSSAHQNSVIGTALGSDDQHSRTELIHQ